MDLNENFNTLTRETIERLFNTCALCSSFRLFGILMCAGVAFLSVIAALAVGQVGEIGCLLTSIPWWQVFTFCAVGFGAGMGVVTLLAHFK